jgi:hypothetical protein
VLTWISVKWFRLKQMFDFVTVYGSVWYITAQLNVVHCVQYVYKQDFRSWYCCHRLVNFCHIGL